MGTVALNTTVIMNGREDETARGGTSVYNGCVGDCLTLLACIFSGVSDTSCNINQAAVASF